MRKGKRNVLGNLDKFLADIIQEIKELKKDLKKLKIRVEKVFPARRGRPPKNLAAFLGGGGSGAKKSRRGPKPKAGKRRGRPPKAKTALPKRGPGRPPKAGNVLKKRGPGRPPKNAALKTGKRRGPGRPPMKRRGRPPKNAAAARP